MVTITIFVAAIMAIFFFLMGIIFKGLASAFNALLISIKKTTLFLVYGILIIIASLFIHGIVEEIRNSNIFEMFELIFSFILLIFFVKYIFGNLLSIIWELIFLVITCIIGKISEVLEKMANFSEKSYSYFFFAIVKRLEKC